MGIVDNQGNRNLVHLCVLGGRLGGGRGARGEEEYREIFKWPP